MPFSVSKVGRIAAKTDWRCAYCGVHLTHETVQVDHFIPKTQGGSNQDENLMVCCKPCNSKKGNRSLDHFREILSRRHDYILYSDAQREHLYRLLGVDTYELTHNEPYQFWYELNQ